MFRGGGEGRGGKSKRDPGSLDPNIIRVWSVMETVFIVQSLALPESVKKKKIKVSAS